MTLTTRQRMDRALSERQVQKVVTDALEKFGYVWWHDTDSRLNHAGLPDIIAAHKKTGAVWFLECKRETGRLRPEQETWADALTRNDNAHYAIVRPSNLDEAVDAIRKAGRS